MSSIAHRQMCFKAETLIIPKNNDADLHQLIEWVKELIKAVNMKIIIGPNFYYVDTAGNEGWTGSCNIETSHMALHWWERNGCIPSVTV